MKKRWWKEAVIYQIYPRSFNDSNGDGIGDIPGITEKVDYLEWLGVDGVWLNPVYDSPNDDNGYDVRNYEKIMDEYGNIEEWEELLNALHDRDINIIMDFVPNHTSDEHRWFENSRSPRKNEYRDYYFWRSGKNDGPPNDWDSVFGGSAWEYDERAGQYYLHLFSKKQPDLNWDNPEVRESIYEAMRFWLRKGVDGLRLDVINFISKAANLPYAGSDKHPGARGSKYYIDGPNVHQYIQEMHEEVFADFDMVAIGETPLVNLEDGKQYIDPDSNELDMLFHFDHVTFDKGPKGDWGKQRDWNLTELKEIFGRWIEAADEVGGWMAHYLSNHDQPRAVSRYGNDQEYRVESAKTLATLLLTLPGTPFIYQGCEIGMTNYPFQSIEDIQDVSTRNHFQELKQEGKIDSFEEVKESVRFWSRDNARTPMQWSDQNYADFSQSKPWLAVHPNHEGVNVERERSDQNSVLNYYRRLIALRKSAEVLVYGEYKPLLQNHEKIFAYLREWKGDRVMVAMNFTPEEVTILEELSFDRKQLLLGNYGNEAAPLKNQRLKPYQSAIFRVH